MGDRKGRERDRESFSWFEHTQRDQGEHNTNPTKTQPSLIAHGIED